MKLALKNLRRPANMPCTFIRMPNADPPDFKSSGEHFNPAGKQHGFDNPNGHHAGDIMNVTVKDDGAVMVTVKNDDVVLGTSTESNSLFANGGTSIMIHAKADDLKTDPSGNSGDRIACGVITPEVEYKSPY